MVSKIQSFIGEIKESGMIQQADMLRNLLEKLVENSFNHVYVICRARRPILYLVLLLQGPYCLLIPLDLLLLSIY